MTLVYFIYGLTMIFTFCGNVNSLSPDYRHLDGDHRKQKYYLTFLWAVFTVILGCRVGFVDTHTYKLMAERIGSSFGNLSNPELAVVETGFNIFMIISNKIFPDTQFFVFLTTAITFACVFVWIYRKSTDKMFSFFLFMTLYMFTYINGIRQAMVAGVFVLLFDKWKDNKWWLIGTCLALSTFHNSALLLIPLCLCINGKVFNWKIKVLGLFSLLCLFVPGSVQWLLDMFLTERYTETLDVNTGGASVIRFLLNAVPLVLALVYYQFMTSRGKKLTQSDMMMINILLVDFAIGICSLRSAYFARMSIYFSLFPIIYVPYILRKIIARNSYVFAYLLAIVVYSVFFIYQAITYSHYGYLREFTIFFLP